MLNKLPIAKTENIVVQELEDEILIYDLATNRAYCLNETSAVVYQACDGQTSFEDVRSEYHFSDDLIFFALDELKDKHLLAGSYDSPHQGMKRREVIKKIGLASMIALPLITSMIAPTSVMAASCNGTRESGYIIGCAVSVQSCVNNGAPRCQSCRANATIGPGDDCDDDDGFPYLCRCA